LRAIGAGGDNKGDHMGQAIPTNSARRNARTEIVPALIVAVLASALIAEAVLTIIRGRANGDLMIMVCPILGSLFLAIPAMRAWWLVVTRLRRR